MAQKQFTKEDIVWIEKYFVAGIKIPRIVEITEKSNPFTMSLIFSKTEEVPKSFGSGVKKINRDVAGNLLNFLLKMKNTLKI